MPFIHNRSHSGGDGGTLSHSNRRRRTQRERTYNRESSMCDPSRGRRYMNRLMKNLLTVPNLVLLLLASSVLLVVPTIFNAPVPDSRRSFNTSDSYLRRLFNHLGQLDSISQDSTDKPFLNTVKALCPPKGELEDQSPSIRKVLVTGSAGFIGFHVAKALANHGDQVYGFDNFNGYYPTILKNERAGLLRSDGVNTVKGELNDTQLLTSIMDDCRITHVVHLAAQAGVRYAKDHPMAYIESNIHGTVSLFEATRSAKSPPEIIYASSSSVYGSNERSPFSEDDVVDHPTSLYGSTKRSVELIAVVYHRLFNLSLTGLRLFTVYGPWGRPDMACFQFAKAVVQQTPITVFRSANGEELGRDFTFVDDIVAGIIGAMRTSTRSLPDVASNRIFNLGNTNPVTVTEFVKELEKALGMEAKVEYKKLENSGDVLFTHANVSKAHDEFDFTPEVSLEEGLRRFSQWFKTYSPDMKPELWAYKGS